MCGSSSTVVTPPPPPPEIQIPPELADKQEILPQSGKFDPVSAKYVFRRAGVQKFRIPSASEQESKITGEGTQPS